MGILYPEVPAVKIVPTGPLAKEAIPEGLLKHNIWAAIDFNEDGQPDGFFASYFCKCPEVAPGPDACDECDCDYACSDSYLKREGVWKASGPIGPM